MQPNRSMHSILTLLLFTSAVRTTTGSADDEEKAQPLIEDTSDLATTSILSSTVTTPNVQSSINHVENGEVFGCSWPEGFFKRFKFCAEKSQLEVGNNVENLQDGLLNHNILSHLKERCTKDNLVPCIKVIDQSDLDAFVSKWLKTVSKYPTFEQCLQENTEAMNNMCGVNSDVSRIVSGEAGLHLNLINVMIRVEKEREAAAHAGKNITDNCLRNIASAVHITHAMYLRSESYKDNLVLCWNVVRKQCDSGCEAFAQQLNCMQSACQNLPVNALQDFGIWQWYFEDAASARESCNVKDEKCVVSEDGEVKEAQGIQALFSGPAWKKRMDEVATEVESTFGVSAQVVLAIFLATLAACCASCAALCAWTHGLCGGSGMVTKRYSRLDDGHESQSLTKAVETFDDV